MRQCGDCQLCCKLLPLNSREGAQATRTAADAHRDSALREYLERRGEEGIAAIIRYSELRAVTIFPPSMSEDGQWHEVTHGEVKRERTALERFEGIASARKIKVG